MAETMKVWVSQAEGREYPTKDEYAAAYQAVISGLHDRKAYPARDHRGVYPHLRFTGLEDVVTKDGETYPNRMTFEITIEFAKESQNV